MGRPENAAAKILIFITSFSFMSPLLSGEKKMDVIDAFDIVKTSPRVESRLIGENGAASSVFCAFNFLRMQNNAKEIFEKLGKESITPGGKLYTLIWLFEHDKREYERVKTMLEKQVSFEVLIGDLVLKLLPQDVFNKIETGELKIWLEMGLPRSQ
jgi:hypothetical protein